MLVWFPIAKPNGCSVTSRANLSLSNLRAVVIVIVVAFHSVLSYLVSQPREPFPFDLAPYRWVAFPILDHQRWFGFDLFCAWQDVSLMSLMFFLAGVFAPASLNRRGSLNYLSDRWRRIGSPFLFAVAVLSPIAYYASYLATAVDPAPLTFSQQWLALPMWPSGPAWFLWQLFVLSALAAGLHALAPHWERAMSDLAARFSDRPLAFVIGVVVLSMLAYVPLAMIFSPWDWTTIGPFSVQLSRPLHYVVYFLAGVAIGSNGADGGLLRPGGPLAQHWLAWLAAAVAGFAAWGGLTSLTMPDWSASPMVYRLAAAFAFPLACATGVFFLLAFCLRLMQWRHPVLDSLSSNAYGIYLVHYIFVVWLQYAMLGIALGAVAKAAIVFAGALALSWLLCVGSTALASRRALGPGKRAVAEQRR